MTDPDTYPTPEDEHDQGYPDDDQDDDDQADALDWQPGECDYCPGHAGGQAEIAAAMASSIVPVCACAIGQGAPADECLCGPELFSKEQLPDNIVDVVDELSRPLVTDDGTVIPPAITPPTEEQPTPADSTVRTISLAPHTTPDTQAMWDAYATRKTTELFNELFGPEPQPIHPAVKKAVEAHVLTVIRDVTIHLTVPH